MRSSFVILGQVRPSSVRVRQKEILSHPKDTDRQQSLLPDNIKGTFLGRGGGGTGSQGFFTYLVLPRYLGGSARRRRRGRKR